MSQMIRTRNGPGRSIAFSPFSTDPPYLSVFPPLEAIKRSGRAGNVLPTNECGPGRDTTSHAVDGASADFTFAPIDGLSGAVIGV